MQRYESPVAGGGAGGCQRWNVCEVSTASYKSGRQVGGEESEGKESWGKRRSQHEEVAAEMTS